MVNTKQIDKNGFSFECPDYYDIGNYPSSDDDHKSIVALSKNDRKCELYIMAYKKNKFDNNAKRNTNLLKRYLQLQNYKNISINARLPYCFNATVSNHMDNIKTTITFDFNHEDDVIMIVGNIVPSSNYDCISDIKIILDSLKYNNSFFKPVKRNITSNKFNNSLDVCNNCGKNFKKGANYCPFCGEKNIPIKENSLKNTLFFWYDENQGYRLSKTKIITWCVLIISGFISAISFLNDSTDNGVTSAGIYIVIGLLFANITFFIGFVLHYFIYGFEKDKSIKQILFYRNDDEIRLSKTKIISLCAFIISGFIIVISNITDPTVDFDLSIAIFVFIFMGEIVGGIIFLMGTALRFILKKLR